MAYLTFRHSRYWRFFASVGLPAELALPIGLLEVIGGIALLVGVLTRITAGLFIIEMIGAHLMLNCQRVL
jgi:putative oxidoreductase